MLTENSTDKNKDKDKDKRTKREIEGGWAKKRTQQKIITVPDKTRQQEGMQDKTRLKHKT